ncbi:OmpW/AlkL family protein [Sedimentitalea arenosa]|uniref:OmpW family protein n=1 Tax=Sedimentitalea arenosa TaxID=2798803 RepID=A0A8J7IX91_9RHOB|nr:OmpW family outer membrane protein [Arenibacterium arenosum]MBJ6373242.1 OmpW family protein [Arenibacterium arenosum]
MKQSTATFALCAAMATLAAPALAQSQGDWTLGIGIANVNPKSDNGTLYVPGGDNGGDAGGNGTDNGDGGPVGPTPVAAAAAPAAALTPVSVDVDDANSLTLSGEYFIRDNIGIELLLATPFEHDISVGGAFAGTTKQLPPTLSINYHFPTQGPIKPFVGLGLNYTVFFDESSPLGDLKLDNSFGLAATVGADWQINPTGALRLSVRYINIETDVSLNGTSLGTAEIDPVVVGLGYVHRF